MSYIAVPSIVDMIVISLATCFLIELSLMWYYFHVTITRRQRIVHVHVLLLQRAKFNVVD